jgi:DNA primase
LFVDGQRPGNFGNRDDYKAQVVAATNIVDLIGKTVSLKRAGKNYIGLCPFHSEKSPSFNVDPSKQYFHCFGCKKGGNVITFVMERDRIEFLDALHLLGDAAGIDRPQFGGLAAKEKAGQRKVLLDAASSAAMFFEKLLAEPVIGKPGRDYLESRGFNAQSVRDFRIGLSVDAWDALLKAPSMKAFPPPVLTSVGLIKQRDSGSGYYDFFRNRLMFPVRDENGRVIAFGGRVMPGSDDPRKYLNSPETPLFSKSRCLFGLDLARQKIVETRMVAVVEGYTDVVMAHQFGAKNVVSPLGTALSASHVQILRRFAEKIVLLFDADAAGDTASNRAVELFLTQPVDIGIASMPDGVDPDEFLLANGLAAFESVLKNAPDALTYTWKQLTRKFDASGDSLTGQQKAVEEYLELLASARETGPVDLLRWGSALARVSRLTGIGIEELNRRFRPKKTRTPTAPTASMNNAQGNDAQAGNGNEPTRQAPDGDISQPRRPIKPAGPLTAWERSERWILAVLLNEPHRWTDVQHRISVEHFADDDRKKLAELFWQHSRDEGEVVFAEFLSGLNDPELVGLAVSLIEESAHLPNAEVSLNDAIACITETRAARKPLPSLERTSGSSESPADGNSPVSEDPNEMLRRLMDKAKRPDLRRTGR